MDTLERLHKQRTEMILSQPFHGALAMRLDLVEDPTCKTLWVDGISLGFNPAYIETLDNLQVRGVIAHEVTHVANGHCWRMGSRDVGRWNDAADYVVNPLVVEAGFSLPAGVILDKRYEGYSVEEVYCMLPEPADEPQNNGAEPKASDSGSGQAPARASEAGFGEVRPYPGESTSSAEAMWKVAVVQAAKAAQLYGPLSPAVEGLVRQAVTPRVDWRAILRRFAQHACKSDYNWALANRRYLHLGLYLPALNEKRVGDAVFVRDSSGSVFDEIQAQFDAEILSIHESLRPARLIIMDCDSKVRQVQIFERGDEVVLKPVIGGGGTAFGDPFVQLRSMEVDPAFVVYLTDLDGRFPSSAPCYPVLWASVKAERRLKARPPFGEIVEVLP